MRSISRVCSIPGVYVVDAGGVHTATQVGGAILDPAHEAAGGAQAALVVGGAGAVKVDQKERGQHAEEGD